MSEQRWQQIEEIFNRAVSLEPDARPAFMDQACGPDHTLRQDVDSLLAHFKEGDTFQSVRKEMASLFAGRDEDGKTLAGDDGPSMIGHYRVSRKIGQGGMGAVYQATDTKLGREVAIKVLPRSSAEGADRISRFSREAKALALLNHPNIASIYGLEDGAIVMELVEGREARGPFPLKEVLAIARQLADGLGAAHERGIIHRDLKPANILLTPSGRVKILDFGLAQIRTKQAQATAEPGTATLQTGPGAIMGTIGYMSPEQVRGLPVTQATDLFSFGVVLYEMLTGERPFLSSSMVAFCEAVLHAKPREFGNHAVPGKLKAIIQKLLEKDPANRYQNAGQVDQELKALEASLAPTGPVRLSRRAWIAVGALLAVAGVWGTKLWRERWALETAAPEISRLLDNGEYVKAAKLAKEARAVLPKDPTLERLWIVSTGEVSIGSEPPGADVSFRPYSGDLNAWESLGKTPLKKVRIPRETYLWRLTKPGFVEYTFIGSPVGVLPPGYSNSFDVKPILRPQGSVPPEMVPVSGGRVGLRYPLTPAPTMQVDAFLIDRHEVANEDYKKFLEAGGYLKREFWRQPFVKDGRSVTWEEAMALFRDSTGRPGPATWEAGDYPKGHEKYPVAGVNWYEAAAYAEFVGKSIPTAYHWTLASQNGNAGLISSGGNFQSEGTRSVGGEKSLSGFGTTDMAGNVKEWCWNEGRNGKRLILGGGFGEPNYMFDHADEQSPWDRRANFGFRCVKLDKPASAAAMARLDVKTIDFWNEKPVTDEYFRAFPSLYSYDKGELNAKVEDEGSVAGWSRTKVTLNAAYGQERFAAHLWLPKNGTPPYQVVVYFPGAGATGQDKLDLSGFEDTRDFLMKSGRAVIFPIYKGMYERRDGYVPGHNPPAFLRDHVIAWSKDIGRALDYLGTRKDIDIAKVAYFGDSLGASRGPVISAFEQRIKALILSSGGFQPLRDLPEVDIRNFVPRATVPVLMLNGRYDATFPLETSQDPFFHFLGTPSKDKKHVVYEGGHGAMPRPDGVRECLDWLDKYLGPVR